MLRALLRDKLGVILLDPRRIFEHDAGQVARGERAVDVSLEAVAAKVWQIATVINVRVAQHRRVHLLRIKREIAIALEGFLAPALEQTAFEQQPTPVDFQQIHRTRRRARCAKEVNQHGSRMRTTTGLSSAIRASLHSHRVSALRAPPLPR